MLEIINRKTGKVEKEKIYGQKALCFLLADHFFSRFLLKLTCSFPWVSQIYGYFQSRRSSRLKIKPFIKMFDVDESEFEESLTSFNSFNDFFIRKLKPECRPVNTDAKKIIMPADGRYLVFDDISKSDGYWVKGKKFSLNALLRSDDLAKRYENGSLAIIRLAPPDYHRFHFPFDCIASKATLINGPLFSVNPLFLKKNISILSENKRMITHLDTHLFGKVLMLEVGATNVGSIHQTYQPDQPVKKGQEKGYFSFGGSCILLLFEKGKITFDADLIKASERPIEIKACFGQTLASSK